MDYDVAIVGGGPVGLMLACELQLAGASVLVLERLTEIDPTIKAGSVTLPTAEASPEGLLDTYTSERHPIGAWVLDWTRAQVALMRTDPQTRALRGVVSDLLATRDGTTYLAKQLSGVLHRYDLGGGHALAGSSAPDLELADGSRLAQHCADGRALLLDLADSADLRALAAGWDGRVRVVTATIPSHPALTGLLMRPDGYVAWAADGGGLDQLERAQSA
jgi:choline dehydrogenase-like flavoprotein